MYQRTWVNFIDFFQNEILDWAGAMVVKAPVSDMVDYSLRPGPSGLKNTLGCI